MDRILVALRIYPGKVKRPLNGYPDDKLKLVTLSIHQLRESLKKYDYKIILINDGYWWTYPNNDHWNPDPEWYNKQVPSREPNLSNDFEDCVDDSLRWKCGYSFTVELPEKYNTSNKS